MAKSSWIDKVISGLSEGAKKDGKAKKLIELLIEDYEKTTHLESLLRVENQHLAYPNLQKEVDNVITAKKRHAGVLSNMITELGGAVPDLAKAENNIYPKGNFHEILEEESELHNVMADHVNLADDFGYSEFAEKLRDIRSEDYELIEKLERTIMRVNAEI